MNGLDAEALIVSTAAGAAALGYLGMKLWRGITLASRAGEVIVGKPARDGNPAVPNLATRMSLVEHEVRHNGGTSLKDSVKRSEDKLDRLEQAIVTLVGLAEKNGTDIAEVKVQAETARQRAAEAVDEAASLSAALGRFNAQGSAERERLQTSLDAVMTAFLDDRREQHELRTDQEAREHAYVAALRHLGIDLTSVAEHLEPWDGTERRGR